MIAPAVFCLTCGSNCCLHLQQNRSMMLTPREISIVRALLNPQITVMKEMAFGLGITANTLKLYMCKIYQKLGWPGGSVRMLTLWAIAHYEQLGVSLPTQEQFPKVPQFPALIQTESLYEH